MTTSKVNFQFPAAFRGLGTMYPIYVTDGPDSYYIRGQCLNSLLSVSISAGMH
jgi:hypothetical protein